MACASNFYFYHRWAYYDNERIPNVGSSFCALKAELGETFSKQNGDPLKVCILSEKCKTNTRKTYTYAHWRIKLNNAVCPWCYHAVSAYFGAAEKRRDYKISNLVPQRFIFLLTVIFHKPIPGYNNKQNSQIWFRMRFWFTQPWEMKSVALKFTDQKQFLHINFNHALRGNK